MNKDLTRSIDMQELEELAVSGGNDYGAVPNAVTTPVCVSVATVLVSVISAGSVITAFKGCGPKYPK